MGSLQAVPHRQAFKTTSCAPHTGRESVGRQSKFPLFKVLQVCMLLLPKHKQRWSCLDALHTCVRLTDVHCNSALWYAKLAQQNTRSPRKFMSRTGKGGEGIGHALGQNMTNKGTCLQSWKTSSPVQKLECGRSNS